MIPDMQHINQPREAVKHKHHAQCVNQACQQTHEELSIQATNGITRPRKKAVLSFRNGPPRIGILWGSTTAMAALAFLNLGIDVAEDWTS